MGPSPPGPADFQAIVDTAVSPFLLLDPDGTVVWASASIVELLGHHADDLIGTSGLDLVAPEHHERVVEAFAHQDPATRGWTSAGLVVDMIGADGLPVVCDVSGATTVRTGLEYYVVQLRRAVGSQALRRVVAAMAANAPCDTVLELVATALADALVDTSVAVAWEWTDDRFGHQVVSSGDSDRSPDWGALRWTALTEHAELVSLDPAELPAVVRADLSSPVAGVAVRPVALDLFERPAGAIIVWWTSPGRSPLFPGMVEETAALTGLVLQWNEGRRALEWDAKHDALTGLSNRRVFLDELRQVGDGAGAVFYLDLDDFKVVNDHHGHLVGDQVLAAVGDRLRSCARPEDVIARLGGDEFAVYCPGALDQHTADERARRFVAALLDPITVDGVSVRVGASVGVALVDRPEAVEDLLARADARLLDAKGVTRSRHGTAPDG